MAGGDGEMEWEPVGETFAEADSESDVLREHHTASNVPESADKESIVDKAPRYGSFFSCIVEAGLESAIIESIFCKGGCFVMCRARSIKLPNLARRVTTPKFTSHTS